MTSACGLPALETILAQTRQLVVASNRAVAASRAAIAVSVSRAASSELRRGPCRASASLRDVDAAELVDRIRSAIDQAVIDREVGFTVARYEGLDRELRDDLVGRSP